MQGVYIRKPRNIELPKRLIYKMQWCGFDGYRMFDTQTRKLLGFMMVPQWQGSGKSLYIEYLKTFERHQGVGSEFIKFAEYLSKKAGKNGHLSVLSCGLPGETTLPHIFYRKMGFSTKSKIKDFIADCCISLGINQCKLFSFGLEMFK